MGAILGGLGGCRTAGVVAGGRVGTALSGLTGRNWVAVQLGVCGLTPSLRAVSFDCGSRLHIQLGSGMYNLLPAPQDERGRRGLSGRGRCRCRGSGRGRCAWAGRPWGPPRKVLEAAPKRRRQKAGPTIWGQSPSALNRSMLERVYGGCQASCSFDAKPKCRMQVQMV